MPTYNEYLERAKNGDIEAQAIISTIKLPKPRRKKYVPTCAEEICGYKTFLTISRMLKGPIVAFGSRTKGLWIDTSDYDIIIDADINTREQVEEISKKLGIKIDCRVVADYVTKDKKFYINYKDNDGI